MLQKNLWDGTNAPDGDGDGRQISWRLLGRVRSARTAASSKRSRHPNELGPALTSTAAACPGIIAAQMSATGGESGASVPLTHSVRPQVSLSLTARPSCLGTNDVANRSVAIVVTAGRARSRQYELTHRAQRRSPQRLGPHDDGFEAATAVRSGVGSLDALQNIPGTSAAPRPVLRDDLHH